MARSQLSSQKPQMPTFTATTELLPAGVQSYFRTLAVMAELVKQATLDYRLKLFVNRILLLTGIKGHDFTNEVATLFFSFVMQSVIRVIRWTWNWYRTRRARSQRNLATVTTRSRFCVACWLRKVLCRALLLAECRLMWLITYGVKSIVIGVTNGYRSIRPTKKLIPAGIKNSLISFITKSGKTRTIAYA